ncbi:DNA internalization-related competence protein ComEC/Rec2 [Brevibacillus migulae]|uniref:DNA internalization-related competence protein ComEC/Rec2 n=1 Tax=Brevibacillus migulae TaxID=1644114 RepID=UPI00106E724B|nr:DNA internalization-related competence protein ComEC/Rec2 [Brevibacillus migulae]
MKGIHLFSTSMAMAAGCYLAAYLPVFVFPLIGVGIFSLCWWLPKHWRRHCLIPTVFFFLAAIYFFVYDAAHHSFLYQDAAFNRDITATGTIASPPKRDGDQVRFELSIPAPHQTGAVKHWLSPKTERIAMRVTLTEESQIKRVENWQEGDRLSGVIALSLPETARNPHAFDYASYLRWQGIYVTGKASFPAIRVEVGERGWQAFFRQAQLSSSEKLDELYPNKETAGYMKSLLLGLQQEVTPELQDVYANLGTLHVLAISGLHVTIVSIAFLWLVEKLGVSRRAGVLITIGLIGAYVLWVGASASAMRAGIMGAVGLWSQLKRERMHARDIWALALIVMLVYDPYQLWQIGFQLSFIVTLGLIDLVPLFLMLPYPRARWLRSAVAVAIVSQLVSFPFVVYWFHLSNPLSLLINLLAVPLLSLVVLPLGYAALALGSIHPALASLAVRINEYFLLWIHKAFVRLDHWQPPFRHWSHPDWWWLFLYGVFLLLFSYLWKIGYHRLRDLGVYFLCLLLLLGMARQPYRGNDEVTITFLDVGQGDSIIVEIGKKTVYLIDGGGTLRFSGQEAWRKRRDPYEVGKDTLLPYLRSRGIEHIDRLIMTHGDADHVGGIPAIIPYFSFGAAIVNHDAPEGVQADIVHELQRRHVPILSGKPGDHWEDAPGVQWTWLHPNREDGLAGNDASVVLLLTAYGKKILFTGDLEQNGENMLLQKGLPTVDILKVAHHGSNTSTTEHFIQTIKPQVAVISVGENNRYGHPAEEVLQRLSDVHVYRTDQHGAILLHISPNKMILKTQLLVPERLQPFKKG